MPPLSSVFILVETRPRSLREARLILFHFILEFVLKKRHELLSRCTWRIIPLVPFAFLFPRRVHRNFWTHFIHFERLWLSFTGDSLVLGTEDGIQMLQGNNNTLHIYYIYTDVALYLTSVLLCLKLQSVGILNRNRTLKLLGSGLKVWNFVLLLYISV